MLWSKPFVGIAYCRMSLTDKGSVFLFRPHGGQHDVLVNMWTGERLTLPDGDWRIGFTDDGAGVLLAPDGEPRLAAEVLELRLQVEQGSLVVVGGGLDMSIPERFNQHVTKFICLRSLGSEGLAVEVAQFATTVAGARVWWSLPSVYDALGLGANSARWYHKSWHKWRAYVMKLGIGDPHMRRSIATQNSRRIENDLVGDWVEDMRCLPWYSLSSYAFVALLCRWSSPKWEQAAMDRLRAFKVCLTAVCDNFWPGDFRSDVFAQPLVVPGVPLQGDDSVQLVFSGGVVDLSSLMASGHPTFRAWSSRLALRARGARWACDQLLVSIFQEGVALEPLFAQLVHVLGERLDFLVCDEAGDQAAPDSFGVVAASVAKGTEVEQRRFNKTMMARVRNKLTMRMAERRLQYFLACRSHFQANVNYSMAVDGSRIGQKNIMAGFIADAEGVCAVCPPAGVAYTMGGCGLWHSTLVCRGLPAFEAGSNLVPGSGAADTFRYVSRLGPRTNTD